MPAIAPPPLPVPVPQPAASSAVSAVFPQDGSIPFGATPQRHVAPPVLQPTVPPVVSPMQHMGATTYTPRSVFGGASVPVPVPVPLQTPQASVPAEARPMPALHSSISPAPVPLGQLESPRQATLLSLSSATTPARTEATSLYGRTAAVSPSLSWGGAPTPATPWMPPTLSVNPPKTVSDGTATSASPTLSADGRWTLPGASHAITGVTLAGVAGTSTPLSLSTTFSPSAVPSLGVQLPQILTAQPAAPPVPESPSVAPAPPTDQPPALLHVPEAVFSEEQVDSPQKTVDYTSLVYPSRDELAKQSTARAGCLGMIGVPAVFAAPKDLEVLSPEDFAVPTPLPPSFVLFGGAKYVSVGPPCTTRRGRKSRESEAAKDAEQELQRLLFMSDQLEVAKRYLRIETARVERDASSKKAAGDPRGAESVWSVLQDASASTQWDEDGIDLSKAGICTVAYAGSTSQVYTAIERTKPTEMLFTHGYVTYGRRQWGLKRCAGGFSLGLGQKATPLQFAAAAGRLDNVLILLASGARDDERPLLKEILSSESYEAVQMLLKPPKARKLAPKAPVAPTCSLPALFAFEEHPPHSPSPLSPATPSSIALTDVKAPSVVAIPTPMVPIPIPVPIPTISR